MELRIKKDGTIYLQGIEIGKAPHTLKTVKKIVLAAVGTTTIEYEKPQEIEEMGLDIYVE